MKAALLLGGVGLLLGVLIGRTWLADSPSPVAAPSYLARLTAQLELSPAQVTQVEALLAEEDIAVQGLVEAARQDLADPIAVRREQTEARLLALLDPEQRHVYDELTGR
jgi:hypothetical protein